METKLVIRISGADLQEAIMDLLQKRGTVPPGAYDMTVTTEARPDRIAMHVELVRTGEFDPSLPRYGKPLSSSMDG